ARPQASNSPVLHGDYVRQQAKPRPFVLRAYHREVQRDAAGSPRVDGPHPRLIRGRALDAGHAGGSTRWCPFRICSHRRSGALLPGSLWQRADSTAGPMSWPTFPVVSPLTAGRVSLSGRAPFAARRLPRSAQQPHSVVRAAEQPLTDPHTFVTPREPIGPLVARWTIRTNLPISIVHASRSKQARAEPV